MIHTLLLAMLAATLMGGGNAYAAGTLYASEYTEGDITLGEKKTQAPTTSSSWMCLSR